MPIETVKQLCTPSAVVTSDSLVEQVAQIEDFAAGRVDGREFFRRNYFTDGLERLVRRGFERLAGKIGGRRLLPDPGDGWRQDAQPDRVRAARG